MKKLLLLLIYVPLIGLGQGTIDCSLLTVTDVVIDNSNLTIDFTIYNGNSLDIHYPYIAYTIDNNGDTIQNGNLNLFMTFALDTSWYSYSLSNSISPSYPLTIYFVYDNLGGMGWVTCPLVYNSTTTQISDIPISMDKELLKVIDILGRETKEVKNTLQFYMYNNGTVGKRITIE